MAADRPGTFDISQMSIDGHLQFHLSAEPMQNRLHMRIVLIRRRFDALADRVASAKPNLRQICTNRFQGYIIPKDTQNDTSKFKTFRGRNLLPVLGL